jgi:RNA polymerase sigma-70 factor (ECF subfamily)
LTGNAWFNLMRMKEEHIEIDGQELIRRMAARDARALEAFYDRYNRIAFTLVLRIVKVREDAEDVLTDVFWQTWQQAGRYDTSRGKPLAWLLTIARTRAIDSLRSSGRRGTEIELDAEAAPETPERQQDPFVLAGMKRAVSKCLDALPEAQRTALELAYFEGMSHTEIAEALKQPLGTMKDRIRTGMMHLRKCLKPYEAPL